MDKDIDYANEIKKLNNNAQEESIVCLDNCVLLACPGAGKTKTLVLKAAFLINEVIEKPRGLACITFSNNAAREFRERFQRLNIDYSEITFFGTFHSFCLSHIVMPFGKILLPYIVKKDTQIAEDKQRSMCMIEALKKNNINEVPDHWFFPVKGIRKLLIEKSANLESKTNKVISVAKDYEQNLRAKNLIDFDDIVLISLYLIKNSEFVRKALYSKYPWIIVDEYQDLNETFHEIILHLMNTKQIKIFAVGDPHQSIHGYGGSDPKYLFDLCNRKDVKKFESVFNYRCCQPIIDASIDVLKQTLITPYISKKIDPDIGQIFFQECKLGADEQIRIITSSILPKLKEVGVKLGDIAILIRNWKDIYYFDKKFREADVPTLIIKEARYELTPLTVWMEDMAKWCAGGWKIGNPLFNDLFIFWLDYSRSLDKKPEKTKYVQEKKIFFQRLKILKQKDYVLIDWLIKFKELFEIDRIFELKTGMPSNTLRELKSFYELFKLSSETNFGKQKLSQFKGLELSKDKVILMSLHSSKGLQFDYVVMPMLEEGIIPAWNDKNIYEARRLFYVGITRAKNEVYLLWSGFNVNSWGRVFKNGPSRFVIELIQNDRMIQLK